MNDERVLNNAPFSIKLLPEYEGHRILDIGGGGEGIIGRLYGEKVVAIDSRKEELLEANNKALKIVMNATELGFLDDTFDTVTSFYTLMYMTKTTQEKAFSEIYRVLKPGGVFEIWDTNVPKYDGTLKDIFVANLIIALPDENPIVTGYGVLMDATGQEHTSLIQMAKSIGFKLLDSELEAGHFNLKFEK